MGEEERRAERVRLERLLPFLPYGCKTPKGRFEVLRWLVPYRTACSAGALLQMADSVLDGVLDKDKNTRNAAMDLFETMLQRCSVDRILDLAKQRRQADLLQIRSIISAFTAAPAAEKKPVVPVGVAEVAEERKDDFQQRKEALGKRAGARVLAKPKLGPDGKPLPKYNVKSSIPKPMPRRTFDALRSQRVPAAKAHVCHCRHESSSRATTEFRRGQSRHDKPDPHQTRSLQTLL